jgi:hypothetical protein
MAKLVNRAKMTTTTVGTGTITLGSAASGFRTFAAAGVVNADVVRYVIEEGTAWEIGNGTYTATGTTLARSLLSSSTGSLLSLGGNATVYVTATAEDFNELALLASPAFTGNPTAPTAAVGTNTTRIATTAFVNAEIANDAPTKTGGGASGTWNIAISGNAATATSATSASSATTLTGLTATVTELNYTDGVTSAIQTQLNNKQPLDADLTAIAALAVTDGNFIVGNGTAWVAESGATARTSLGLGSLATASTISNANWSGTDLSVANGGTGASDAGTARTNLGLAIGTNVQAWDANLDQIAALAPTADNFIVGNGTAWILETPAQALASLGVTSTAAELNFVDGVTSNVQTQLNAKAPLASPALTGTPTAPTAAVTTNTTQIATTAFVNAEIANDAPTKTGGGASGTWSIAISGNAATATTLQTSRNINGTGFNGSANIDTTEWVHSNRDFPNGTLITTSIDYSVTNGDPFVLEIRGNSYGDIVPFDLIYQGYIYADTIINHGGISNGTSISGLVAINNGGNLCFWFPSQGYWHGYNVKVYTAYATRATNRVTSITGVAKPTTAKEVALSANIRQSLHSSNYTSYAPSLTGSGASGTWGINVTGNAATASTATTLTGLTSTVAELNFVDGVTSNVQTQLNAKANLASPALTGNPTAPTQALGNNSTRIATTAFVNAEIANDAPTKTGGGASGTWAIAISGNAATATTLQTARTINGVSFNGSANITVADSTKLPLAGGTVTGDIIMSGTGFLDVPVGTTAQRPVTPSVGMIRFNTTRSCFEGYNGTGWVNLSPINFDDIGAIA